LEDVHLNLLLGESFRLEIAWGAKQLPDQWTRCDVSSNAEFFNYLLIQSAIGERNIGIFPIRELVKIIVGFEDKGQALKLLVVFVREILIFLRWLIGLGKLAGGFALNKTKQEHNQNISTLFFFEEVILRHFALPNIGLSGSTIPQNSTPIVEEGQAK
jgi:hypothetical protein